jgi:hypothetical protein
MTDTPDLTPEAVERPLDEAYDTMIEVERNPYGAWLAIQSLSAALATERARAEAAEAKLATAGDDALEEAAQKIWDKLSSYHPVSDYGEGVKSGWARAHAAIRALKEPTTQPRKEAP